MTWVEKFPETNIFISLNSSRVNVTFQHQCLMALALAYAGTISAVILAITNVLYIVYLCNDLQHLREPSAPFLSHETRFSYWDQKFQCSFKISYSCLGQLTKQHCQASLLCPKWVVFWFPACLYKQSAHTVYHPHRVQQTDHSAIPSESHIFWKTRDDFFQNFFFGNAAA